VERRRQRQMCIRDSCWRSQGSGMAYQVHDHLIKKETYIYSFL
jgi:hypothetical protein